MNLLTLQLKQKLAEWVTHISENSSRNDSCKVLIEELKENTKEVKQNNTRLHGDIETLQLKYNILNTTFENTTTELKNSFHELKQLKNVPPFLH